VTCRVLGVRRQGFYEWCSAVTSPRAEENEVLVKHIERIHAESRGTYGWPRVHAERSRSGSGWWSTTSGSLG
jgi:putative transposase